MRQLRTCHTKLCGVRNASYGFFILLNIGSSLLILITFQYAGSSLDFSVQQCEWHLYIEIHHNVANTSGDVGYQGINCAIFVFC